MVRQGQLSPDRRFRLWQTGRLAPCGRSCSASWVLPTSSAASSVGYSKVAAPLTALTSTLTPFGWTQRRRSPAWRYCSQLHRSSHLDPALPFTVEVDASESGVGAVLSQWTKNSTPAPPSSAADCPRSKGTTMWVSESYWRSSWPFRRHWLKGPVRTRSPSVAPCTSKWRWNNKGSKSE